MSKSKRRGANITPITQRVYAKGVIESPFRSISDVSPIDWSSWKDDFLPNMLWAVVVVSNVERDVALALFRQVSRDAARILSGKKEANLGHNYLATLSFETFSSIFAALTLNAEAREACRSLVKVESLPDHSHWKILFSDCDRDLGFLPLIKGVSFCLDHQSQEATDVRWLKVFFLLMCDRLRLPAETMEELRDYPDRGDMRRVRPSIRAMEMAFRQLDRIGDVADMDQAAAPESFWKEMFEKTECIRPKRKDAPGLDPKATRDSLIAVLESLCDHFMKGISTTAVDARLDGAFGLAINMLTMAVEVSAGPSNHYATGRIVLRTIVEHFITLKYLSSKDDAKIWLQYRNHGSSQSALAYLKNVFAEEVPDFIDIAGLEMLANEDAWQETKDIIVGNWAKLDLRKMATDSGIKDFYDSYYDWTSAFVHGNWGAVRDSAFTICMNPLHRLHRIPSPGNSMPSVLNDCCKICNRALDEINKLYPTFKPRVDWKSDAPVSKE